MPKSKAQRSKWSRYKQLSIRIGTGKDAEDYLKRIDAAMRVARRKTRADWCKFVIDLALEGTEVGDGNSASPFAPTPPLSPTQLAPPKAAPDPHLEPSKKRRKRVRK